METNKDPLGNLLRSKRETTRFQVLVEVAEHQPSIRQQEIAGKLGVTPQAISEYIRDLADDGFISAEGRGRYSVTRSGIEWVLQSAEQLENYARHVRRDIIQQVAVWAAIAAEDLKKGEEVGVFMKGGWLYAGKEQQSAMGIAIDDAEKGTDIGVARLSGLIDHTEGTVCVCKVPRIERGGSRLIERESLYRIVQKAEIIGAVGVEAYMTLKRSGIRSDMFYGAREGVIEAAFHGMNCAIIVVDSEFTDFIKRLENSGLSYTIHDLAAQ